MNIRLGDVKIANKLLQLYFIKAPRDQSKIQDKN